MKNNLKIMIAVFSAFVLVLLNAGFALSVASFQVTAFSCSPTESVINNVFSCTATIKNIGDASGSVSTATLYPDAADWLESASYPQASATSVSPEQTTDVTFTGLRAVKAGNNGFSKIMLDSVTDTYVADQNKKVNIINVAVGVSNSASSVASGGSFTSTSEITAGGNIDVSLTFTYVSGGCSIGSQTNPKTFSSMTDGSKQSWAWTITQGTAGDCKYTVYASATGAGRVASKVDSTSSTVTCTGCSSGSDAPSGGGGGGGGDLTILDYDLGELKTSQTQQISAGGKIKFSISSVQHSLTMSKLTDTNASITIASESQSFTLFVGDEIKADLNSDSLAEVSVKLKSIDTINKKATFVLTPILTAEAADKGETTGEDKGEKTIGEIVKNLPEATKSAIKISAYIVGAIIVLFIIGALIGVHRLRRYLEWMHLIKSVKVIDKQKK